MRPKAILPFSIAAFTAALMIITSGLVSAQPAPPASPPTTSTLCQFTSGPRAGQTQDYAPKPPLPIGTPCNDGAGSTGTVIAPPSSGGGATTSTLCQFTAGPKTGQTQDYAPQPPLPIGTPCNDGAGSTGTVVAPP